MMKLGQLPAMKKLLLYLATSVIAKVVSRQLPCVAYAHNHKVEYIWLGRVCVCHVI